MSEFYALKYVAFALFCELGIRYVCDYYRGWGYLQLRFGFVLDYLLDERVGWSCLDLQPGFIQLLFHPLAELIRLCPLPFKSHLQILEFPSLSLIPLLHFLQHPFQSFDILHKPQFHFCRNLFLRWFTILRLTMLPKVLIVSETHDLLRRKHWSIVSC